MVVDSFLTMVVSIFFATLFTRLVPTFSVFPSYDVYGHNLYARRLKQGNGNAFDAITLPTVCPKPFAHPFFWHWLVGKFDLEKVLERQKYINAVFDALFISFLCWLLSLVISSNSTLFMVGLLYAFSPLLFTGLSIGPRANQFTPRLTAELLVCSYFFILVFSSIFDTFTLVLLLTIFGSLGLMWSKFSVQAILFISVTYAFLSFCVGDPIWGTILIAHVLTLVIVGAISRGRYIAQLKEQISHLIYYAKSNFRGQTVISNRNNFTFLIQKKGQGYRSYMKHVIESCLVHNSYILLILKFPLVVFVLASMVQMDVNQMLDSTVLRVCLASFIIYFFVNLKWFLFLGEAERYITNTGLIWILGFCQLQIESQTIITWLIIIYGAVYLLAEALYHRFKSPYAVQLENKTQTFLSYLQGFSNQQVIFMLPNYVLGGLFRICISTKHICVDPVYSQDSVRDDMPMYLTAHGTEEEQAAQLDCLLVKYNVTLIVVDYNERPEFDKIVALLSGGWRREDTDLQNVAIFKR